MSRVGMIWLPPWWGVPAGENAPSLMGLTLAEWFDVLGTVLIVVGGFWALYIYRSNRKNQVRLAIDHVARVHRNPNGSDRLFLLHLTISNPSGALFRYRNATVTVMDASTRTADGQLRLIPFAADDPFIPVNAAISTNPDDVLGGRPFVLGENFGVSLEPGEALHSELAFVIDADLPNLLAVQVMITGRQGTWGLRDSWWGSFFYVDLTAVGGEPPHRCTVGTWLRKRRRVSS